MRGTTHFKKSQFFSMVLISAAWANLALWVFHPMIHKVVCLVNMEVHSESTTDITTFFMILNKMLAEVAKQPNYKFNPNLFMMDQNAANF